MNNPYKFNADVLGAWAEIMNAVPNSRFLFVRPEGGAASFRRNLSRFFDARGVDPKRLLFIPVRGDHLRHYNEMDISLDTFPQTGGTTTCETLFMGVPVVTLAGLAIFERLSYSNLVNAGLPELVAYSRQGYVATAIRLAKDREWRKKFRTEARDRLAKNPLGRGDLFARDFEQAATNWMDEAP
jgi:predicted O-linked N-acetylglucosamine transferase (SPINDLY family)